MKLQLAILVLASLALSACAAINVPLGSNAKYGTITVGYIPPDQLPAWVQAPTLRDK